MTRRALLLGAAYGSLLHVPRSLERLAAALARHGFTCVERHLDLPAEALLAALTDFLGTVEPGDAVAIAYVGHAGRAHLRPARGSEVVVGLELGAQLAALVRRTANVTLVLDCCHAAGVVEDASHLTEQELRQMIAHQRRAARGLEALDTPVDAVVQLLAAAAPQNAVEDLERAHGLFSGALADVLERCVDREVGWHEVVDAVRLRMRPIDRHQAPTLAGRHRRRVPFTERDSALRYDDFACAPVDRHLHLAAGALHGVELGERFVLRALGSPVDAPAPAARVTELGPEHAVLTPDGPLAPPTDALPLRAVRPAPADAPRRPPRPRRWADALALAPALPARAFEVRWGRVEAGGRRFVRLPGQGARIAASDDLWIAFGTRRNEHAFALFFALLHVDPDGRLAALAPAHPQGVPLAADRHFLLATALPGGLARADALDWRKGQPAGEHSWALLVSNRRIEVADWVDRGLEVTRGPLAPPTASYALAELRFTVA